jgi:hypothetical protein
MAVRIRSSSSVRMVVLIGSNISSCMSRPYFGSNSRSPAAVPNSRTRLSWMSTSSAAIATPPPAKRGGKLQPVPRKD